jgi:NADH:ubiquinone oxidoreductase subunit F (NADH-binding)
LSLDDYLESGGGRAIAKALTLGPEEVLGAVKDAGLRGRGGAGFPTAMKWGGLRSAPGIKYLCVNFAEGEPSTYKDRWIVRHNPYQFLEGVAIAAYTVGVVAAYVAVKEIFTREIAVLRTALREMTDADLLGYVPINLTLGPDSYLFGEEKALLEVVEGKEPAPRILPPYQQGLFFQPNSDNPTLVNNVETMYNVPLILRYGPQWWRSVGPERSPGTMVFTLCGDVQRPGMYELPMGTPLRELLYTYGGGPTEGHELRAVVSGCSMPVITPDMFDTPLDFDSMAQAGTGLGSAALSAWDETACMVQLAYRFSRFLHVESCDQCNACKLHSQEITNLLWKIESGEGTDEDVADIVDRTLWVTDANRCFLPQAESALTRSFVVKFIEDIAEHLEHGCNKPRPIMVPKIIDFDEATGTFTYDEKLLRKRPNWTYADEPIDGPFFYSTF